PSCHDLADAAIPRRHVPSLGTGPARPDSRPPPTVRLAERSCPVHEKTPATPAAGVHCWRDHPPGAGQPLERLVLAGVPPAPRRSMSTRPNAATGISAS